MGEMRGRQSAEGLTWGLRRPSLSRFGTGVQEGVGSGLRPLSIRGPGWKRVRVTPSQERRPKGEGSQTIRVANDLNGGFSLKVGAWKFLVALRGGAIGPSPLPPSALVGLAVGSVRVQPPEASAIWLLACRCLSPPHG